ncbi:MAG: hypothetical protein VYC79_03150 [Bacteroidota bacterium]|nr:hypothetical protein [Bacteroidota bacterium]
MSSISLSLGAVINKDASFILSGSKSITQRALIINSLCENKTISKDYSDSDDSNLLKACIQSNEKIINVSNSGTTLRFLISYYLLKRNKVTIVGDERLFERPITQLISYLRKLGGKIVLKKNKIILEISNLKGGTIEFEKSNSSQFISSILLISPFLKGGLKITRFNNTISQQYINMTISMMKYCGANIEFNNSSIIVQESKYSRPFMQIESDWSCASYLYLAFLLSSLEKIQIQYLNFSSSQPDNATISFFSLLGIRSIFKNEVVELRKVSQFIMPDKISWNFVDCPDFSVTAFVACLSQKINLKGFGLNTLPFKESNRLLALKNEIEKFECLVEIENDCELSIYPSEKKWLKQYSIETYNDHRIALAFSTLSILGIKIEIPDLKVINKSYPNFFNDLTKFGVIIKYN